MKKYFQAAFFIMCSLLKFSLIKLFHMGRFKFSLVSIVSPFTELEVGRGSLVELGKNINFRSGARIKVRKGAELFIGDQSFLNHNCMIVSHESISIGRNVQVGPNTLIYDHDHDYRAEHGLRKKVYKTSPVTIGDNVWIGANVVILRGTSIGDNCVIGAGSIIRGNYLSNQTIIQKRETTVYSHE
ncbi:acyltransferase [Paenibacillus typhae]|uniref:acyltransferase n=1 Tax=Paenibacillus typhae TaxID=1174501 RepID=UPI001C8D923A|nr:acyltransferase [Paenibacillus typhae]MBY0013623.1 acyltransferase [Paenibacillus typhae]